MNCVSINLKKEETIIKIDDNAEQEQIIKELTSKISELSKMYKEENIPIRVTGKILKNSEIDEIRELITQKINVNVNFDTPTTLGLHSIVRSYKKDVETSETLFHKGSLRSGQKIEYEGSLVILGDVNAGAEILAGENIVVLGILRGMAHAGAKGNKEAMIAAASIEAPQIRIANIIKEIERLDIEEDVIKTYAYVNEEGEIVLE